MREEIASPVAEGPVQSLPRRSRARDGRSVTAPAMSAQKHDGVHIVGGKPTRRRSRSRVVEGATAEISG